MWEDTDAITSQLRWFGSYTSLEPSRCLCTNRPYAYLLLQDLSKSGKVYVTLKIWMCLRMSVCMQHYNH